MGDLVASVVFDNDGAGHIDRAETEAARAEAEAARADRLAAELEALRATRQ